MLSQRRRDMSIASQKKIVSSRWYQKCAGHDASSCEDQFTAIEPPNSDLLREP